MPRQNLPVDLPVVRPRPRVLQLDVTPRELVSRRRRRSGERQQREPSQRNEPQSNALRHPEDVKLRVLSSGPPPPELQESLRKRSRRQESLERSPRPLGSRRKRPRPRGAGALPSLRSSRNLGLAPSRKSGKPRSPDEDDLHRRQKARQRRRPRSSELPPRSPRLPRRGGVLLWRDQRLRHEAAKQLVWCRPSRRRNLVDKQPAPNQRRPSGVQRLPRRRKPTRPPVSDRSDDLRPNASQPETPLAGNERQVRRPRLGAANGPGSKLMVCIFLAN